jgi:ribulose-phosphate 3-epimerase
MIDICPTVDAETPNEFRRQMERVAGFAQRVHIDLGDGDFTPNVLVPLTEVWWPAGIRADLHVMYRQPFDYLDELIALGPQLIIVQAEAEGDFPGFVEYVHGHGIEAGVALLQQTSVESIMPAIEIVDHVLIFSGNLGYQGGSTADLKLLDKVLEVEQARPFIEIGWDGGVNDTNIRQLTDAGVEVLNVGGFIQKSDDPESAFKTLKLAIDR